MSMSANGQFDLKEKPITVIIPFATGGGTDATVASLKKYAEKEGIRVIARYAPGAEGEISMTTLNTFPADGRAILLTTVFNLATSRANNHPTKVVPITMMRSNVFALVTSSSKINSFNDITPFRIIDENIFIGHGSSGQRNLITFILHKLGAPITTMVPYKGTGPLLIDILGKHIDIACLPLLVVNPYIISEKVKLIALSEPMLPYTSVPTLSGMFPDWRNYDGHVVAILDGTTESIRNQWLVFLTKFLMLEDTRREFIKDMTIPVSRENIGKQHATRLLMGAEQMIRTSK